MIRVTMPRLSVTMSEGKVTEWLKKEGETVQKGDSLFEVEADKVTSVIEAQDSGVLRKILVPEGSDAPVGAAVAILTMPSEELTPEENATESISAEETIEATPIGRPDKVGEARERISPLARRLAEEYGVDISNIKGTGPDGRIVKEDILTASEAIPSEEPELARDEVREISVTRKIIAERLSRSHLTAVHVTVTTSVDMTEAIALRERLGPEIESKTGSRLSYTDIIVKVVGGALREYPIVNSKLLEGDKIKLFADVNVGVAVALEDSLIVPVVHNADKKSIAEIVLCLEEKIEKARKGELSPDEVAGGTFTVSNLGIFDIEVFTPIINPPECAILGVGKIIRKPWVVNDHIEPRPIVTLSLSFDHRIIDGSNGRSFPAEDKGNFGKAAGVSRLDSSRLNLSMPRALVSVVPYRCSSLPASFKTGYSETRSWEQTESCQSLAWLGTPKATLAFFSE